MILVGPGRRRRPARPALPGPDRHRGAAKRLRPPGGQLRGRAGPGRRPEPITGVFIRAPWIESAGRRRAGAGGAQRPRRGGAAGLGAGDRVPPGADRRPAAAPALRRTGRAARAGRWRHERPLEMVDHQAQEGRRGQEARQALHQAVAGDHRRRQGGRPRPGRRTPRWRPRSPRHGRTRCPRTTSSGPSSAAPAAARAPTAYDAITYEGYGPEGVAIIVEALTDNRNRTAADVRAIFSKHNASLGTPGSVAWQFERKGVSAGGLGRAGRGRDRATGGRRRRGGRAAGRRRLAGDHRRGRPGRRRATRWRRPAVPISSAELTMVPKNTVALRGGRGPQAVAADRCARGQRRRPGRLRQLRHPRRGAGGGRRVAGQAGAGRNRST